MLAVAFPADNIDWGGIHWNPSFLHTGGDHSEARRCFDCSGQKRQSLAALRRDYRCPKNDCNGVQLAFPLSSLNISVGGSVLVLLVNLIVISMVYGSLIMLLSAILKSNVAVMAIPVGIMILTMMVDIPYQFRLASQVYDLLPTNILNKTELWDDRLICIWGKYFTNFQIAPFLYVVFAVLLVIIGMVIYQRHQVQAR